MEDLFNPGTCRWLRTCSAEAFHPSALSGGFLSNAAKMMERDAQQRRRALAELVFSDTSHATTHQDYCLPPPKKNAIKTDWKAHTHHLTHTII